MTLLSYSTLYRSFLLFSCYLFPSFSFRSQFLIPYSNLISRFKIDSNLSDRQITSLFAVSNNGGDENAVTKIQIPSYAKLDEPGQSYPSPLHTIHVHSNFLSPEQASVCLKLARDYAEETSCWENVDQVRHVNYRTADFSLLDDECPELVDYLNQINFHERIFTQISQAFGICTEDDEDHYMTYLDLFCVNYQASDDCDENTDNDDVLDRLEPHRDGSLFSFTVLLSCPKSDFSGGGTFFDALQNLHDTNGLVTKEGVLRPHQAGDAVLHTGKTLHGAEATTSGQRTVLVGFVDLEQYEEDRFIRPGILRDACRDWGRLDTSLWRTKRHTELSNNNRKYRSLYNPTLDRPAWLAPKAPDGSKKIPSVHTRRINATYQRSERLKIEDIFLRNILLTPKEREDQSLFGFPPFDSNDITIL